MEASENTGLRRNGSGGPAPHRIDPDRVPDALSLDSRTAGLARLNLMVGTIFDRLMAGERDRFSGP